MDWRERNAHPNWLQYDTNRMVIILDSYEDDIEYEIPAVFDVCPVCEGRGHHVDPGIDSHGINMEEFYEDPEFAEEYFDGAYDVPCNECRGDRVVLVPRDPDSSGARALNRNWQLDAEWAAEIEAERRVGA